MRLRQYLDEHSISVAEFAAQIGVTVQAVYRYLDGDRLPERRIMEQIKEATGGTVTPNDFYCCPEAA